MTSFFSLTTSSSLPYIQTLNFPHLCYLIFVACSSLIFSSPPQHQNSYLQAHSIVYSTTPHTHLIQLFLSSQTFSLQPFSENSQPFPPPRTLRSPLTKKKYSNSNRRITLSLNLISQQFHMKYRFLQQFVEEAHPQNKCIPPTTLTKICK